MKRMTLAANPSNDKAFESLLALFYEKGWIELEGVEVKLKRCHHLLSMFNAPEEQNLILDMLSKFNLVDYKDYYVCFNELLNRIQTTESVLMANIKKIAFVPLLTQNAINKNEMKSSRFVWYLLRNISFFTNKVLEGKRVAFIDIGVASKINSIKKKDHVFLLDDYIGSGGTAEGAINYLLENGISADKMSVLAIAAQGNGIDTVKKLGVRIFYLEKVSKAISDTYPDSAKECALELMRTIEDRYGGVNDNFSLGYKHSEALWSLVRTPNNTLPIFYLGNKAPFERK